MMNAYQIYRNLTAKRNRCWQSGDLLSVVYSGMIDHPPKSSSFAILDRFAATIFENLQIDGQLQDYTFGAGDVIKYRGMYWIFTRHGWDNVTNEMLYLSEQERQAERDRKTIKLKLLFS